MLRAQTFVLAICFCASLGGTSGAFAQTKPQPDPYSVGSASFPDQNRLVGFDALARELAAQLVKEGQEKVILVDFVGPDKYRSPFADWLADQFSLALKTSGRSLKVMKRVKLAAYEPIEENEYATGTAKIRAALDLGADTFVEGTYRPAENGVGVSLVAHRVSDPGGASSIWSSPISTVGGKVAFTKEIGSTVFLPLDAVWPKNKKFTPGEGGVGQPRCIYCPAAQFSEETRKKQLDGIVAVMTMITAEGHVAQTRVDNDVGSSLEKDAVDAVKRWRFAPATDADGRPVAVYILLAVRFPGN